MSHLNYREMLQTQIHCGSLHAMHFILVHLVFKANISNDFYHNFVTL